MSIDSFKQGLEGHDLGVCNLSLKDHLESWTKMTSRRARNMFSGSKWGFLRTVSLIVTFSTPPGVIFKVRRLYFKVKIVNFGHFISFLCVTHRR